MKKIFTLLAGFFMTVSAVAQDELPAAVSWEAQKNVVPEVNTETGYKTVLLLAEDETPVISCEFLDGVVNHANRDPQDFVWVFNQGAYATAWDNVNGKVDGNGMEVRFTPSYGGTLAIVLDAALAANKPLNMYVNDDTSNTISATVGETVIESGAEHAEIPAKTPIVFTLQKGKTYNFYGGGTKWRFKSFTFTPTDNIDASDEEADKKIAVISPMGEDDDLYFAVQEGFDPAFLTEATLEELQEYEAILISNKVTADSPMKDVLRSAVAYQPVVNMSAALVEAWGLGTVTNSESNMITVSEANLDNSLFADLTYDEGFELVADGVLPVVTPGEYLKNDDVLATVGEAPYILVHNAGRNAHILIPFDENGDTSGETLTGLVANALKVAAKSKKAVTKTAAPTFSAVQGNLETTVTINGAGVIRYALGADATVNAESAIYTEPIKFTEETVIKAYALQDGYLDSDVASYEVAISAKAEKPLIIVTPGEGKSAVISFEAQDGAEIHFSFAGQAESSRTDAATTQVYTEPVTVYEPTTVYAFAVGEGLLASDLEEMSVSVPGVDASNIRLDVVSHMTGGNAWRSPKLDGVAVEGAPIAANVYMGNHKSDGTFGVGSNNSKPWTHYSSEIEKTEMVEQQAKDEDGNPMVDADGNPVMETVEKITYKADPNAYHELTCDEEPDWKLVSEGQCMIFETGLGANSYLFDVNKYPGSKPVGVISATDLVSVSPSNGALSWKGKNSGEPYNGRIESTKAFDAPFDIVLFTRNAASDGKTYTGKVLTSTDGKEWSELQEVSTGEYQRCINRHRISVEGEGKFYVRFEHNGQNVQLHDIYILNNGELSQEYTGLEEVISDEAAEVISVEYFNLNGMRIAEPENGFYIMRATLSNGKTVVNKVVK